MSQAYDLLNDLTVDAQLSTYDDNEHSLALKHSAIFKSDDLVLYDRNYASFWMFALLKDKRTHFCARLKTGSWKVAKQLVESGDKEITTKIVKRLQKKLQNSNMTQLQNRKKEINIS